jgi:hypothetical protein
VTFRLVTLCFIQLRTFVLFAATDIRDRTPSASVYFKLVRAGKATHVTSRGRAQGCEAKRRPHFLDSRLTHGGEDVNRY